LRSSVPLPYGHREDRARDLDSVSTALIYLNRHSSQIASTEALESVEPIVRPNISIRFRAN
jgi:hypothetical protein